MLEPLSDLPPGVVGVKASGTVSKEDYEKVLEPMLDDARRQGRRIKFLYHFGPEFDRFTAGAAWEDVRVGLGALRLFEACAVVSDVGWLRESTRFVGSFLPCPIRTFSNAESAKAVQWLASLPQGTGTMHRLHPEAGVIVVEIKGALSAQDFDAVAATADVWIESHDELHGVVLHTREFPGWENVGSLLRHIKFVRDHHKKVRRVALASDSKLATLAPRVAEHFVEAEVKQFSYDELERAVAWASTSADVAA